MIMIRNVSSSSGLLMLIGFVVALFLLLVSPICAYASVPDQVTLTYPYNGTTGVSTFPRLTWLSASGATSYQVQISNTSSFSDIVFDKTTTSTSIVVRLGDLASSFNGGGLWCDRQYWWRVRGINTSGTGPWSSARSFTTKLRQDYSPYNHTVCFGQTYYDFGGRWDQQAKDWYEREQKWVVVRWRLWWESELRFANGDRSNHYSQVVFTESNLPSYNFEFQADEIGHQTRRPDYINANQYYWAGADLAKASNQPSQFRIAIESEITDWSAIRAFWDLRRATGFVSIPFDQTWNIP